MSDHSDTVVVCLCAAWCRLCDDYARVLDAVRDELAAEGLPLRTVWIDIEDDADLVGDFDVETFPTLLLVHQGELRFAGAVTPQPQILQRLLRALVFEAAAEAPATAVSREALALAARLRSRWLGS